MIQINFTLNQEEIQSLIKKSLKGTAAQLIFTDVLNRVMEEQRSEYIRASAYERSNHRQSLRNGYIQETIQHEWGDWNYVYHEHEMVNFHQMCLNGTNAMNVH